MDALTDVDRSGQDLEPFAVCWPDDAEVASVDGGHGCCAQAFCNRNDGGIDRAQWQVAVCVNQLGYAQPVTRCHRLHNQVPGGEIAQEPHLGVWAQSRTDEVRDLGDDQGWHDKRPRMLREQIQAGRVMSVVRVDVGVERARIDDQRDAGTSLARISSIRSEMSEQPLRPAAAAPSRRRDPRWCSIASLVSSEMVMLRRAASCLRRASSSEGSLTVVRFTYASIPNRAMGA